MFKAEAEEPETPVFKADKKGAEEPPEGKISGPKKAVSIKKVIRRK